MLILLDPETEDIPLKERVRRANAICTAQGPANVLLLSQEGRREIIETIIDGIERCVLTLVSS